MQIILITGISGSGKTVALHVLEDAGYFCVDNLPPSLLCNLVETLIHDGTEMLAIATDARSATSFAGWRADIQKLKDQGHDVKILFLTANTETLINRFSETRRRHPLSHRITGTPSPADRLTLAEYIEKERDMLSDFKGTEHIIDTSNLTANKLRNWVKDFIDTRHASLTILFTSFGFKYGVPLDADLVFDVRMLPNPHYDLALRPLTGKDEPVIQFLDALPIVQDLYNDIEQFVEKWLPAFKRDNRSYLTVAIGCTGGQHRSVYIVEKLVRHFTSQEHVVLRHRQLS